MSEQRIDAVVQLEDGPLESVAFAGFDRGGALSLLGDFFPCRLNVGKRDPAAVFRAESESRQDTGMIDAHDRQLGDASRIGDEIEQVSDRLDGSIVCPDVLAATRDHEHGSGCGIHGFDASARGDGQVGESVLVHVAGGDGSQQGAAGDEQAQGRDCQGPESRPPVGEGVCLHA